MRILITGAGGPAALSFLKAITGHGHTVVMADMDPLATGLQLVAPEHRVVLPAGDAPEFVPALLNVCSHHQIDVLVPTVDAELIPVARGRGELEALGVAVLSGPLQGLESCLDKWMLFQACSAALPFPLTTCLGQPVFADARLQPRPGRPVIVKPRRGSGSRGVVRVDRGADLVPWYGRLDLLLQEYLPGPEYSVDVLASATGEPLIAVPRLRLRVDSGVAIAGCTVHDPVLEGLAASLVASLKLPFVSNVQLRLDAAGQPRVLEINPRFPGTMPLTVAAGVNMPAISLDLLCGREAPRDLSFREIGLVRQWQEHLIDGSALLALSGHPSARDRAA